MKHRVTNAQPREKNGRPKTGEPWDGALRSIDLPALRPVFPELAGEELAAEVELRRDRKLVRSATRRRAVNALQVANAVRPLDGLPAVGETWHLVVKGNFALFDLVPAALKLAAPATIRRLDLVTLGFSKQNLQDLLALLDNGQVGSLALLYSVYFRSNEKETCHRLEHELAARNQRVAAMRTHAKVMLLEMTDGRCLVNETSANLRSCRNVEQMTLTHDRPLLEFHRRWIEELLTTAQSRRPGPR